MSFLLQRVIPAAAAALFSLGAQATTLTFDDLAHADLYQFVTRYTAGGYVVTNGTNPIDLGVWGTHSARQADFGGAALFNNYSHTTTTLRHLQGDVFEFQSIDIADVYNQARAFTVDFTFTFSDGVRLTETIHHGATTGLQRFTFNQPNVISVSWANSGVLGSSQFDNVSMGNVTTPIPEP
ncbi:MAG: hypothetical protein V4739_20020, partial [Pseudomonadota bacterium]